MSTPARRVLAVAVVACALLALAASVAGCSKPNRLTSGVVLDKHYDDPDTYYVSGVDIPGTCSGGYGSVPMTCTPGVHMPGHWQTDPAHWSIRVRGTDHGKELTEWHTVTEAEYAELRVGQMWDGQS